MARAVLYDLDGVIIDSRALVAATLSDVTMAALGHRPAPHAVGKVVGLPPVRALQVLGVADAARVFDSCFDRAYATRADQATVVPGMVAVMRQLRAAGIRQAVVTLQRRHRLELLALDEVHEQMDAVVTFEDAPPKPAPDGVSLALQKLDVPAGLAWFVGDTGTDIAAAHAAGVPAAAVTWGYTPGEHLLQAGADVLLARPEQIIALALPGPADPVGCDRQRRAAIVGGGSNRSRSTADGEHGGSAS